jgi:hypothetical protein
MKMSLLRSADRHFETPRYSRFSPLGETTAEQAAVRGQTGR